MKISGIARWASFNALGRGTGLAICLAVAPIAAHAGEQPLYQAPPSWVEAAPPVDPAKAGKGSPLVILDMQQRLEAGVVWNYIDTAVRADTPDALTQLGTLKTAWAPDKGDLIVHRAEILRGGQRIDLLTSERFTVLRREQQLERRQLDGLLTATMPVPGLQVGDVVRLSMSITNSDKALVGNMQAGMPIVRLPAEPGFVRLRASWPEGAPVRWQVGTGANLPATASRKAGGYRYVDVPVPLPKREDMPKDAPMRFTMPSLFQLGTFASWQDVSRVMAPLFATDGLIAPDGPVATEVAAIKAATPEPMQRAARALELVQSKISYLLKGMDGGNYVPQPPAKTWELRYGDCKAKTLLLLAMLRAMDIEAEPVLALSAGGDVLPQLLPAPGDFDHVLVHARIAGEDLWLDGTDFGTRLADLRDTPRLFNVLPLRPQGASLMAVTFRPNARPNFDVRLTMDERAGIDLPTIYDIAVTVRGAHASQTNTAWVQANATDRRNQIYGFIKDFIGDSLMSEGLLRYDETAGTATITARGLLDAPWAFERGRQRQAINLLGNAFAPDRARPAWRDVAVARDGPTSTAWNTTYLLPGDGAGMTLDGDAAISADIAGARLVRTAELAGGTFTLVERADWLGRDVEAPQIEAERAKAANARSRIELVAPADVRHAWDYDAPAARGALAPVETVLGKALETWPEGRAASYTVSANVHGTVLDWRAALADITKAIDIEPSAERYLARLGFHSNLGDKAAALKDADLALALDPASSPALLAKANVLEELGRADEGITLLNTQLSQGSQPQAERSQFVSQIANLMASKGDSAKAISLISDSLASNPGDPVLLNARCWTKATRQVELDTALRDCTKAIELSDAPAGVLDSRAMVYFRLGRMDDALADLEAALQSSPGLTPSSYMRGIIHKRIGSVAQGQSEIQSALRRDPTLQDDYRKFGITP